MKKNVVIGNSINNGIIRGTNGETYYQYVKRCERAGVKPMRLTKWERVFGNAPVFNRHSINWREILYEFNIVK